MRLLVSGTTRTMRRLAGTPKADYLGVLLTPDNGNNVDSILALGLPWACDNAAFSCFSPPRFLRMLSRIRTSKTGLLWVCCPDAVGDAKRTNHLWNCWQSRIRETYRLPAAFVLQDGQETLGNPPEAEAYFIGGTDDWKLSQASADLARWVKARGKPLHMGRVNSKRRMFAALDMGCDSFDGTSTSRWGDVWIPKRLNEMRQFAEQPKIFGP
jgi:hypothetical protein